MESLASPNLVVISGSGRKRQITVPAQGIVLGRDGRLGPPFSTDEFVSRNHVSVQHSSDGGVEIADLGSVNGTYLNGTPVRGQARMQEGDVLRIGQIELKLDPAGAPRAREDSPCLVIVAPGAYRGRRFQLSGAYMVVGRDPMSDVYLDDRQVSRIHAALQRQGDEVYVQDLGSSGGTSVNGAAVTGARELCPGDIVAFAGVTARFEPAGGAVTCQANAAPAETPTVASAHYHVGEQRGQIINNVGRDQHNSYAQQVIAQRESFLREIAATKTKARWLIWTGSLSFAAGLGLFAAGVLGFARQVRSEATATQSSGVLANPFGHSVDGIPYGLIGWAMGMLGMLAIIVGIVLHVVATSRRKRVDRELPVPPPWLGAGLAGRAT